MAKNYKAVLKGGCERMTLEDCIYYHDRLGVGSAVNDGKDVTFSIEKPLSLAANKGLRNKYLI